MNDSDTDKISIRGPLRRRGSRLPEPMGVFVVGAWLSLVERFVRDEEVAGSNPVAPTMKLHIRHSARRMSQRASTPHNCSRSLVPPQAACCARQNKSAAIT